MTPMEESKRFVDRSEARAFLIERYAQQCQRFPRTTRIPEGLYVRRNLAAALRMTTQ